MTKTQENFARADSTRVVHPLFQTEEGGSTPTSALQLLVVEIKKDTYRDLLRKWHSRLPECGNYQSHTVCYGKSALILAFQIHGSEKIVTEKKSKARHQRFDGS